MGVRRIPRTHLRNGIGEQTLGAENTGILGEEAEDQPRHEMVHVMATLRGAPVGIVLKKLNIKPVQAAGGSDIEGVLCDLLDGRYAGERQEEAEMIGEIVVLAGDCLAIHQVLGL